MRPRLVPAKGVLLLGVPLLAACLGGTSPDRCKPDSSDKQGYVYQACQYVREHDVEVTSDPNNWVVRRIDERIVEGKPMKVVTYSCCYLGDVGYFDANDKLVEYEPGAK